MKEGLEAVLRNGEYYLQWYDSALRLTSLDSNLNVREKILIFAHEFFIGRVLVLSDPVIREREKFVLLQVESPTTRPEAWAGC